MCIRDRLEVEHLRPALIACAFALGELGLDVYEQARPLFREPLVVALAAALRSLDDGQPEMCIRDRCRLSVSSYIINIECLCTC